MLVIAIAITNPIGKQNPVSRRIVFWRVRLLVHLMKPTNPYKIVGIIEANAIKTVRQARAKVIFSEF